ncbi:hypothetical protein HW555_007332 [Spodoptera exigua]|uniref:N-acetyltransferase domain-containing protein n=1 Tax=Spodoptera exigua TaxID=7107 RepID=A0A835GH97_SPOEX|nr:hypothetical protein HW555_007332 [Spodoptera exigua]
MSASKVWSKFSVTKGGDVINLRVVDMPENLTVEVMNFYVNYLANEDFACKAAGIAKNPEAIEEMRVSMLDFAKEKGFHAVICCLDNGDGQIKDFIGASMMAQVSKEEPMPEFKFKAEELNKMYEIYFGLESYYDEAKEFGLDSYFSDRGLFVRPEYRNLGVEQELLKIRRLISKERGISLIGTWMTTQDLQKAAENEGWETACEVKYEELGQKCGVKFEADTVPESEEAMEEITEFVLNSAGNEKPQVTVCCYDNGDDDNIEVLGVSIMTLVRKSEPPPKMEFKSEEMKKLMEIVDGLTQIFDEEKVFNLDPCFSDRGLVVCPDYRGLGIAQELLKVRLEYGIPVNGAWMTSYGTQKAAARDGWETACELQYEDLDKKFNVTFPKNPPSTKFMIAKIAL